MLNAGIQQRLLLIYVGLQQADLGLGFANAVDFFLEIQVVLFLVDPRLKASEFVQVVSEEKKRERKRREEEKRREEKRREKKRRRERRV